MSGTDARSDDHPTLGLDDVVHQRARLGILWVLSQVDRADFTHLRTLLRMTDGNLGRHLEALAGQGLIELAKGFHGRRPRTWVVLTPAGREAYAREIDALRRLVAEYDAQPPS